MKFYIVLVALVGFATGLDNSENGLNGLPDSYLKHVRDDLLIPLQQSRLELQKVLVDSMDQHSQTMKALRDIQLQTVPKCIEPQTYELMVNTHLGTDFEACANLTRLIIQGGNLTYEGYKLFQGAATRLSTLGNTLLNCPSINPISGVKCLFNTFNAIKSEIANDTIAIHSYKTEVTTLVGEIKTEFNLCTGRKNEAFQLATSQWADDSVLNLC